MSNDGSFKEQIRKIAIKTREMSGWVLRTFKSREKGVLLTLWKSLIIPHFDYCSQLWSPTKAGQIQELEVIQKAFIKNITGLRKLNYWEQLKKLKLYFVTKKKGKIFNYLCMEYLGKSCSKL